jgi:hypothetical protein
MSDPTRQVTANPKPVSACGEAPSKNVILTCMLIQITVLYKNRHTARSINFKNDNCSAEKNKMFLSWQ